MAPPAETAPARLTLTAELGRYRERIGPILASTVLPFVLVLYLALEGGGYDFVVRSEVGIAIWWIVLLGALVGVLPVRRLGRNELIVLGLLIAFALWTAIGISWSNSSERSVDELGRVLTYVGVLGLSLAAQDREALRRTIRSVGGAIAVVGLLALLSRLEPSWIHSDQTKALLPDTFNRLAYPLNYWNGLAALLAIGIPLVLTVAVESRRLITQAVATAALPMMALATYYTLSRGGAIEVAVALIVLFALYPRRFDLLPTLALGIVGGALAIGAATQRGALQDNLQNATATRQGHEMLAVILIVCAGVALIRVALGLAARHELMPRPTIRRDRAALLTGGIVAALVVIGLAAGVPHRLSHAWSDFKNPNAATSQGPERFSSAGGSGRYQYWKASVDAFDSKPLTGIGPGTYEYWWAQKGSIPGFVRDAHSLFLQTLAELGLPGLALILALLGSIFVIGARKWRRAEGYERALLAAALAAGAAFVVGAAIDWSWEMTVIPVAFLLVSAAMLRTFAGSGRVPESQRTGYGRSRALLVALAVISLVVIAVPMLAVRDVRDSQADARSGNLTGALDAAKSAGSFEDFAAAPNLQKALVFEAQGKYGPAASAAQDATRDESTNWRNWLVLSRIEAERGDAAASVAAYQKARSLNPRSALFTSG